MCWQVDLAEIVTAYNWVAATVYEAIVKKGERSHPTPPPTPGRAVMLARPCIFTVENR